MIKFRGLDLPKDITIFIATPFTAHKWRKRVNKSGFSELIRTIIKPEDSKPADIKFTETLVKHHKVMTAYLKRIKRDPNPCMITSLSLMEICMNNKIAATLVVGADKKDNSMLGHSWIEINGSAINECDEGIKKYTRMMEV